MGKSNREPKSRERDGDTKILYKKSNNTLFSRSKTCSGASLLYSRPGVLHKNLERVHNYYEDNGTLKRDLSIETDICVLRRYYKIKKNRMLHRNNSTKSKYLTVREDDGIKECLDKSACGDSSMKKCVPPLDITTLMIANLKYLLNQWVQEHFLDDKDAKQKIDTLLDSLLQKIHTTNLSCSSLSTYVLHRETQNHRVKNKKIATSSISFKRKHKSRRCRAYSSSECLKDSSSITLPYQYSHIKLISTLSLPKRLNNQKYINRKYKSDSWHRIQKNKRKNLALPIKKVQKILDSSSLNLLTISTKSFTKGSVNYDIKNKYIHDVQVHPKHFEKGTSLTPTEINANININNMTNKKLDNARDLPRFKSVHANHVAIIANLNKDTQYETVNGYSCKNTTTLKQLHQEIMSGNFSNDERNIDCLIDMKTERDRNNSRVTFLCSNEKNIIMRNVSERSNKSQRQEIAVSTHPKSYSKKNNTNKTSNKKKRITHLYKKYKCFHHHKSKKLVNRCENLLQYFIGYEGQNKIKLDIRINVFPERKTDDVDKNATSESKTEEFKEKPTLTYALLSSDYTSSNRNHVVSENISSDCNPNQEIINLLDGAVSEAKYILNINSNDRQADIKNTNTLNNQNVNFVGQKSVTHEHLLKELGKLRSIVKDLAKATEKFLNEQIKTGCDKINAETNVSKITIHNTAANSKCQAVFNSNIRTKGTQLSKKISKIQQQQEGFKITKRPKNRLRHGRLSKRSTSYRTIESESLLKVTDMTSKADIKTERSGFTKSSYEMFSNKNCRNKVLSVFSNNNKTSSVGFKTKPSSTYITKKSINTNFHRSLIDNEKNACSKRNVCSHYQASSGDNSYKTFTNASRKTVSRSPLINNAMLAPSVAKNYETANIYNNVGKIKSSPPTYKETRVKTSFYLFNKSPYSISFGTHNNRDNVVINDDLNRIPNSNYQNEYNNSQKGNKTYENPPCHMTNKNLHNINSENCKKVEPSFIKNEHYFNRPECTIFENNNKQILEGLQSKSPDFFKRQFCRGETQCPKPQSSLFWHKNETTPNYEGLSYKEVTTHVDIPKSCISAPSSAKSPDYLSFRGDHTSISFPEDVTVTDQAKSTNVGKVITIAKVSLYCTLVWIPICIILYFCNEYLSYLVQNKMKDSDLKHNQLKSLANNDTDLYFRLSELGF